MFKSKIKSILLLGSLAVFTLGCNLDYFAEAQLEEFTWNPSIALPIGEITYNVGDLFRDLTDAGVDIGTNAEDIVTFIYQQELQSQRANEFVQLINQNFTQKRASGITVNNPGTSTKVSKVDVFSLPWIASLGEDYDSVAFSSGNLLLQVTSDLDANVDFTFTLRSFKNSETRAPLIVTGVLTPENPIVTFSDVLSKYTADLSKDENGNTTTNLMVAELSYSVNISPSSSIQNSDGLNVALTISDPKFETAYVFVGQKPLDISFDLINLEFFDAFGQGTINFAEPIFRFSFENSFGFPLGVTFNEIAAVTKQGQIIRLEGSAVNQVNLVAGPTLEDFGEIIKTDFELTRANSNLPILVNSKPTKVIVDVNAFSNPNITPAQYNFMLRESELKITGFLEMPMIVNINDLSSGQKVALSIAGTLEQAQKLLLRIVTENNLPLGGEVELAFLDDNDNELYVVSERAFFDAAPIGSNDRTSGSVSKIIDILLSNEEVRLIEDAVSIDVRTKLNSTNSSTGQAVKFYSDYELKVKLAAQADVNINSNGN